MTNDMRPNASPRLRSVATSVPAYRACQEDVARLSERAFDRSSSDIERLMPVFGNAGISTRYFCMPPDWYLAPHGWVERSHLYVEHAVDLLADAAAMHLVKAPKDINVLLADNLFGDILSDEASMLTGSIGMLPSASLDASGKGLYEPSHGSAPDIAGKNIANPLATILSSAMMLRYTFNKDEWAYRIEAAVKSVLAQGYRTADIYEAGTRKVGTREMGDAVVAAL